MISPQNTNKAAESGFRRNKRRAGNRNGRGQQKKVVKVDQRKIEETRQKNIEGFGKILYCQIK